MLHFLFEFKKNYIIGLQKRVDNSPIIVFRIFFGFLMWVESWGAILTGWVSETFVHTPNTLPFIGFEWTRFMIGDFMYVFYMLMGILGIMIMLGYRYRLSTRLFFAMWGLSYLMQKSHYNNHYYLVWIVSGFMMIVPAHTYKSIDVRRDPSLQRLDAPYWTVLIFRIQVAIVYTYAAIAKLYPGWIENKYLAIRLSSSASYFRYDLGVEWFARFLELEPVQYFMVYAGIVFDLFVVPMLLFQRTRKLAFIAGLVFHLMNSIVLHIGIFPYFALSFSLFFYSREFINRRFLPSKPFVIDRSVSTPYSYPTQLKMGLLAFFLLVQILLPLRHWIIPENVLWNEAGHRLSWRMMLRNRWDTGLKLYIQEKDSEVKKTVNLYSYLSSRQIRVSLSKPDCIWQTVQLVKQDLATQGITDYALYGQIQVAVNGGRYFELIDPKYNLKEAKWNYFGHQDWIFPTPEKLETFDN